MPAPYRRRLNHHCHSFETVRAWDHLAELLPLICIFLSLPSSMGTDNGRRQSLAAGTLVVVVDVKKSVRIIGRNKVICAFFPRCIRLSRDWSTSARRNARHRTLMSRSILITGSRRDDGHDRARAHICTFLCEGLVRTRDC